MVTYRHITTQDPAYAKEKDLRNRVLRRPLGLELSMADLRGEEAQEHIVAVDVGENVVGCVLIVFSGSVARLRQLAVDDTVREQGVGKALILRAEEAARKRKAELLTLHARTTARPYFEKLGYRAVSDVFTEVTIPHIAMEKRCR